MSFPGIFYVRYVKDQETGSIQLNILPKSGCPALKTFGFYDVSQREVLFLRK